MASAQRQFACDVVAQLRQAGYTALWAGGCVRDQLLGVTPKDYDVATSATPEQVREVFGRRRTIPVGASFGVMTVLGPKAAGQIEVATFRTDGGYSDGRHPDQVQFSTPEHDAQRRDFTINGLFYDPQADEVHDYVGGEADLLAGIVRAIGAPEARIAEDKLRMLRAVRFAARFDFAIDQATLHAVQHHAGEITQVSGERIGAEMRAMLVHPNRAAALSLLRSTGLESYVLPETTSLAGEPWQQLSVRLGRLEGASFALVLAVMLAEIGDVRAAESISDRWKLANRDADRTDWLLNHLPIGLAADTTPWPQLQRVLIHEGAAELVALVAAQQGADSQSVVRCREKLALPAAELNPPPLVTGADLIAAGLQPGPQFGELLERIRDAQLEGKIATRDEALALAR
ncbi:CCA tRNA nucleotidyltransferase [Aeoliella sp. ICT_H6.2]|uniref:CCA tRNA nucleotidyltransferase n=1 Tax=Aeoliella straminimaris TaxID=2954799 RepID=A0A9X2F8E0_9BACT|nr:CCA tRNA nucleotidyltransferase [Aeoliella straminimaris]MCO6044240.1 CCA tRNA nucleotidyltransferase [Aeoliella straminimaris]